MKKKCNIKLFWIVSLWSKWQIVIPKDIRNKLNVDTWWTLAIFLKDDKYIWLVKNEDMWEIMEYINSEI